MHATNFAILILAFCASSSIAIRCYHCTYDSAIADQSCYGPNVSSTYLVTCPAGYGHCSTGVAKATSGGIALTAIIRNCSNATFDYQCFDVAGINTCVYSCSTDSCNIGNGSKMVTTSLSTFLITICISLLVYKL